MEDVLIAATGLVAYFIMSNEQSCSRLYTDCENNLNHCHQLFKHPIGPNFIASGGFLVWFILKWELRFQWESQVGAPI